MANAKKIQDIARDSHKTRLRLYTEKMPKPTIIEIAATNQNIYIFNSLRKISPFW
jgi:hypothetical protein